MLLIQLVCVIDSLQSQMDIKGGVTNFRRKILSIDINELTDM